MKDSGQNYLARSLESQADVLVVAVTLLGLLSDRQSLPFGVLENSRLTLVRTLGLFGHLVGLKKHG